jgi:hypothetical protein
VTGAAALMRGCLTIALGFAAAGCASSDGYNTDADLAAPPPTSAPDRRQTAAKTGDGDVQPEQLLGLDADQLTALLGRADFTRSDGPAEIRQFRDSDCMLDVFLYQDPSEGGGYRVEHVETRDRGLVRTAERTCVAGLLRARRIRAAAG